MRLLMKIALGILFAGMCVGQEALLQQARSLEDQRLYYDAANVYLSAVTQFPEYAHRSQTAVRAAFCFEKAALLDDAISALDLALSINDSKFWESAALFHKARTCRAQGCMTEAYDAISRLQARHPDTTYAARAEVIRAFLDSRDPSQAETLLKAEQEATQLYQQVTSASQQKDYEGALRGIEILVKRFPNTPAALRAAESKGAILATLKRYSEAHAAYQAIIDRLGNIAPASRIVQAARISIAFTYHGLGMYDDEKTAFAEASAICTPEYSSYAAAQLAGRFLEDLQSAAGAGRTVNPQAWENVRNLCRNVLAIREGDPLQHARAVLMIIESFAWEKAGEQVLQMGDQFLQRFTSAKFKREIATVRMLMGRELQKREQYDEALAHFRWIVDAYTGQKSIWGGTLDHLPRTYFRVWEVLRQMSAPAAEITAAADTLQAEFPESDYARFVRLANAAEAANNAE